MAKTKNHSVRFEQSDFDFICKREKLTTAQSIVSFLMGNYIKIYKVEKKSIFLIDEQKDDAPKKDISFSDETKQQYSETGKSVEQHYKEIKNLETPYEYEQKEKEIKEDESLNSKERTDLLLFIKLPKGQ